MKTIPFNVATAPVKFDLPEPAETILLGRRGSHAHGTYIPPEHDQGTDDEAWFVVYRLPRESYLGMDGYHRKHTHYSNLNKETGIDILAYDVRKFVDLLIKGNPNVHSWLWTHPDDVYMVNVSGEALIDSRESFLSRRIFDALVGYAKGQHKRMQTAPTEGAYMGEKRKELMRKYGYNVKNGAHCIRLLIMGETLARTGELPVRLEGDDLDVVLSIKMGDVSLEDFRALFVQYVEDFEEAEQMCSFLRDSPDINLINELLLEELI